MLSDELWQLGQKVSDFTEMYRYLELAQRQQATGLTQTALETLSYIKSTKGRDATILNKIAAI